MYGNPEVTTGGKALKFYASVRIDVRRVESLKNGSEVYGSHTRCKVVKNKVAPPFKTAEFDILYGSGISKSSEIIDMAIQLEIIEKSGAWFYYEGDRLGQGKDNVRKLIESDKELMDKLEALVREKVAKMADGDEELSSADDDDFEIKDFDEEL
jgi:recombination protein RecA